MLGRFFRDSEPASRRFRAIAPRLGSTWVGRWSHRASFATTPTTRFQLGGNAGWTKGTHNVKFGFDLNQMYLNHYETAVAVVHVQWRRDGAERRDSPNIFNQFAHFLSGAPSSVPRR